MRQKRVTRSHFAGMSVGYRLAGEATDPVDREILMSHLALSPGLVVLDIATGAGRTAVSMAPRVGKVVAADLTPEMLREARGLAADTGCRNIDFVAADAESLPFADASFDRVTCRVAPHHFPDLRAAIREMMRVVRPGGMVGIVDSISPEDPALDAFINGVARMRDPTHVRSYRIDEWVSYLKEGGLSLTYVNCAWKVYSFPDWVAETGQPEEVCREVEEIFLGAFPRARDFFRVRVSDGTVLSHADEKGIFIGRRETAAVSG